MTSPNLFEGLSTWTWVGHNPFCNLPWTPLAVGTTGTDWFAMSEQFWFYSPQLRITRQLWRIFDDCKSHNEYCYLPHDCCELLAATCVSNHCLANCSCHQIFSDAFYTNTLLLYVFKEAWISIVTLEKIKIIYMASNDVMWHIKQKARVAVKEASSCTLCIVKYIS